MRSKLLILFGLFAVCGSAAHADVTAVYKSSSKAFDMAMTVEIADDGKVRYQMSVGSTYGLVIDDVDYFVQVGPQGSIVQRVADLMTAQKEAMAGFLREVPTIPKENGPELILSGTTEINGRPGRAYIYASQMGHKDPTPVVVVSDDPKLAQIGKVMAHQFSKSSAMMGGMLGQVPGQFSEMERILKSGAAIRFAGMELASISDGEIDPKRFELPAPPQSLDQVRASMKPLPPPPTVTPEKH